MFGAETLEISYGTFVTDVERGLTTKEAGGELLKAAMQLRGAGNTHRYRAIKRDNVEEIDVPLQGAAIDLKDQ